MANDIKVKVYSQDGKEVSELTLDSAVFGVEPSNQALYDAVNTYQANLRQGTAKTKKRHEVSGGGKKPWRQKGTGRARAGSIRSPLWVGGGKVFGPTGIQNFKLKMNKKAHDKALKSALTLKLANLVVLDKLEVSGKTKELVAVLKALNIEDKKVLLVSGVDTTLRSSGNIPSIISRGEGNISVYDLLDSDKVLLTVDQVKKIEEELK
jgi:large subunit ribosomal protein L4